MARFWYGPSGLRGRCGMGGEKFSSKISNDQTCFNTVKRTPYNSSTTPQEILPIEWTDGARAMMSQTERCDGWR